MRNHWLTALGSLYLTLWFALIMQQIDPRHKEVLCWFYNPILGESSFSERITLAGYWIAIVLCANHFRRTQNRGYLVLALLCFGLFLEESNYGAVFYRFFGLQEYKGKSVHGLFEETYASGYRKVESLVQLVFYAASYLAVPIWLYRVRRSRPLLALALIPAAIWGYFLLREQQWVAAFGQELDPHHPCVSIDEAILGTLFPFSIAYLLLLHRFWDTDPKQA